MEGSHSLPWECKGTYRAMNSAPASPAMTRRMIRPTGPRVRAVFAGKMCSTCATDCGCPQVGQNATPAPTLLPQVPQLAIAALHEQTRDPAISRATVWHAQQAQPGSSSSKSARRTMRDDQRTRSGANLTKEYRETCFNPAAHHQGPSRHRAVAASLRLRRHATNEHPLLA